MKRKSKLFWLTSFFELIAFSNLTFVPSTFAVHRMADVDTTNECAKSLAGLPVHMQALVVSLTLGDFASGDPEVMAELAEAEEDYQVNLDTIRSLKEKIAKLKRMLRALREEHGQLIELNALLLRNTRQLETNLQELSQTIEELSKEVAALKQTKSELERSNRTYHDVNETLNRTNQDLNRTLDCLRSQIADLKRQVEERDRELCEKRREIDALKADKRKLIEEAARLSGDWEREKRALGERIRQIEAALTKEKELTGAQAVTIGQKSEAIRQKDADIAQKSEWIKQKDEVIGKKDAEIGQQDETIKRKDAELVALRGDKDRLANQVETLAGEKGSLLANVEGLNGQVTELTRKVEGLTRELSDKKRLLEELTKTNGDVVEAYKNLLNEKDEEIRKLEESLKKVTELSGQLLGQVSGLMTTGDNLRRANKRLKVWLHWVSAALLFTTGSLLSNWMFSDKPKPIPPAAETQVPATPEVSTLDTRFEILLDALYSGIDDVDTNALLKQANVDEPKVLSPLVTAEKLGAFLSDGVEPAMRLSPREFKGAFQRGEPFRGSSIEKAYVLFRVLKKLEHPVRFRIFQTDSDLLNQAVAANAVENLFGKYSQNFFTKKNLHGIVELDWDGKTYVLCPAAKFYGLKSDFVEAFSK